MQPVKVEMIRDYYTNYKILNNTNFITLILSLSKLKQTHTRTHSNNTNNTNNNNNKSNLKHAKTSLICSFG